MELMESVKIDLSKTTTFYNRPSIWFKMRDMDIRDYQDTIISQTEIKTGDKLVWAVSPNGGKTEMATCYIDLYLEDNPSHKVLVLTRNNTELRKQFSDRVEKNKPNFTYQNVTANNEVDFTKQVIISLPSTLNKRKLPKFDLVVIDEAHHYYESDYTRENSQVKRIIKRCEIKKELLLTGTPSYFIRKNQEQKGEVYKMVFIPMSVVYDAGGCSDVIIEMATSSYYITDKDYRGDEIKDMFNFKKSETHKTLDDVNQKIYNRIISQFRNSKKYSNKELFKPLSTPLDWFNFRKKLGKTLISCRNKSQAKKTAEYYIKNGIDVALSTYEDDRDSKEIQRFIDDTNCKILIVVFRGILGFSLNEIENVIDMSLTKNINRMYQLFCRATRKLEGVDKLFIKVIPSDREPHFRIRLTGMLCLMHDEWFSKFNGKNFEELDIPTQKKSSVGRSSGTGGTGNGSGRPKKEPFPMLGLPSMELLKDLYTKRDELYSPVCWSKVGAIISDLNLEFNKRRKITTETIDELYSNYQNRPFKELNISNNSGFIQKARDLGIHDELIKKYNILYTHWIREESYSLLLDCKSHKDVCEKGYSSIYSSLMNSKDKKHLIQKYIGHFEKLRVHKYSEDILQDFFNQLPVDEYPETKRDVDKEFNGKYRAIFIRGKDNWYNQILSKWGEKVPMAYLNDEDKIKRIKKHIDECKDYMEWYRKYVNDKRILRSLNQLHLLDKLNKDKKLGRNEESMEKLLGNNKDRSIQEFRDDYPNDYQWMMKNERKDIYKPLIEKYLKRQR